MRKTMHIEVKPSPMQIALFKLRSSLGHKMQDEWARRFRKRAAAVAHVHKSEDYQRAICRPPSPDPTDVSISKRNWESQVMEWRRVLKNAAAQFCNAQVPRKLRPTSLVCVLQLPSGSGPPASEVPKTCLRANTCDRGVTRQVG